jgi:hypothetical protein
LREFVRVVEVVCYGGGCGGKSLLWWRKLVRREGKLRENNYGFCDFLWSFCEMISVLTL